MKRPVRVAAVVIAVQGALLAVYWLVEHQRSPDRVEPAILGTAPPERVDTAMPRLTLRNREGSRVDLRPSEQPTLVHIWATWCPPCRAELPGLLALPNEHPVDVVAIALDDDWEQVERFLDGLPTSDVVLGDADEVERALGVRVLPVTYLAEPGGRLRLRFDGARDWKDSRFLNSWIPRHRTTPNDAHGR